MKKRMDNILKYFRLFHQFFKCSLMNSLEYKFNFFFGGVFELIWMIMNVIFFNVIFMNTDAIGGWKVNQVLILVFFCGLCDSVITFAVNSGCGEIPTLINQGTMDFILLKPISKRFYLSFRKQNVSQIFNMIFNIAGIVLVTIKYHMKITKINILLSCLLAINGMFINYLILFTLMTLSFWVIKMDVVFGLTQEIFTIGNKPVSIYPKLVQKIFTYIIPMAIAFNYPVMCYSGMLGEDKIVLAFGISLVAFILSNLILRAGLKKYSSACS